MAWYDNPNKIEDGVECLAKIKYDNIVFKKAKSFMDIVGDEIEKGVQYRIVTDKGFNAISVIEYLSNKYEIEEIYVAVYRMNILAVNKLIEFVSRQEVKCNILVSSFFRENKKYEKWANDLVLFSEKYDNAKVCFAQSHAKVFLAKTKCGKNIVFEGSGNLSDNSRIEQYIYEDNERSYNFHSTWIKIIIEKNNGNK